MFVLFSYVHPKGFYCLTKCPLFGVHSKIMGTILQRYKTGNEKVTDILSDQTIPRFVVSHYYSIWAVPKMPSVYPRVSVEWISLLTTSLCISPSNTYAASRSKELKTVEKNNRKLSSIKLFTVTPFPFFLLPVLYLCRIVPHLSLC